VATIAVIMENKMVLNTTAEAHTTPLLVARYVVAEEFPEVIAI
jgi:hypothetical protein